VDSSSWCCTSKEVLPLHHAAPPEEKKVEATKEGLEESDDDMGFGLFD
jgi:ribosomal protein L12E/L44/L45/RPP1/RPP2